MATAQKRETEALPAEAVLLSPQPVEMELSCLCGRRYRFTKDHVGNNIGCTCGRSYKVTVEDEALGVKEWGNPIYLLGRPRPTVGLASVSEEARAIMELEGK